MLLWLSCFNYIDMQVKLMETKKPKKEYGLSKIYTYKEHPHQIVVDVIIATILRSRVPLKISSS